MEDGNISYDLRQLAHGQVKALEYSRYDINGYHFWTVKLEASCPLAASCNNGVVTSGEDANGVAADYYGVLQKIIEYTFGVTKELKGVFFQCVWFDPIHGTRVDDFGMVEVKHESRYTCINLLLAHQAQQVYYLSYPHINLKNWWVVYKVNPEIHTRWYDEYMERNEEDDIYQEEIKEHENFTISDRARLTELATRDVELMEEEQGPSKKHFQKSQGPPKKSIQKSQWMIERREQLNARVTEADSDADDFW
jgi:hypothetical protein